MLRRSLARALIALTLSSLMAAPMAAQDLPSFSFAFGGAGTGDGELGLPRSVAIHAGEIYVAEYAGRRISVFDLDGNFQRNFGSEGSGDGQFNRPKQIAVAPDGSVYVTDEMLHRVQKFDSEGNYLLKWGSQGSGDAQFNSPDGIAIDSDGDVWVCDRLNTVLKEFDSSGNFKSVVSGGNPMIGLTDVVVTPQNTFYVIVWGGSYQGMRHFDAAGNVLASVQASFVAPRGMAQAPDGELYITATGPSHRAYIVDPDAMVQTGYWGGYGDAEDNFKSPYDVAVAPNGAIYIAESETGTIKVFQYTVPAKTMSFSEFRARFGG